VDTLTQDVRYAFRSLLKHPGLSAVIIVTLSLGIGANTTVFSFVYGMMLRPLGYPEEDRLVNICDVCPAEGESCSTVSIPDFVDWQEQSSSFAGMGICVYANVNLAGGDHPEEVTIVYASAGLLPVLGFYPKIGRLFGPEENQRGKDDVVVLSDSFWRRQFGGDPDVVGKTILLDNAAYRVLGVLPEEFDWAWGRSDLWSPWAFDVNGYDRKNRSFTSYARLKPGVSVKQARAEMEGIASRLAEAYPDSNGGRSVNVVSVIDSLLSHGKLALVALTAAVGFVLLIACANVAHLLLARATDREKEFAIRSALGASKWRVSRQMLAECTILALAGASLGMLITFWALDVLTALLPEYIPRKDGIVVDRHVLLFTLVLSLASAMLCGLMPALKSSDANVNETLKEVARSPSRGEGRRVKRDLLVVGQVAMALALVICATLMTRSLLSLQAVDLGFDAQHLLTMRVKLPAYRYESDGQRSAFFDQVTRGISETPGVVSAAGALSIPLDGWNNWKDATIESYISPDPTTRIRLGFTVVTPRYFETMGIPLLRGRDFTNQDDANSHGVVIVSENVAERFWPDEDPIGKRLKYGERDSDAPWYTVIGVVGSMKKVALHEDVRLETFRPYAQIPRSYMAIVVRTSGNPLAATSAVEDAVWRVDPDQAIYGVRSMENMVVERIGLHSFLAALLTVFAAIALTLAAMGLYAVMSYVVSRRTHEIGIRIALGAQVGDMLRLVIMRSVILTGLGIGGGITLAMLLGSLLESLMYGVSPTDPATFALLSVFLAVVTVGSSYFPVRRAMKVDPIVALRCE